MLRRDLISENKKPPCLPGKAVCSSSGKTRTYNPSVNSRMRCHGTAEESFISFKASPCGGSCPPRSDFSEQKNRPVHWTKRFVAPQVRLELTTLRLTAECSAIELLRHVGRNCFRTYLESGGDLLSRAVSSQVPSALKGLTSVFGMGTGGTPSPLPPEIVSIVFAWPSLSLAHARGFCPLGFRRVTNLTVCS